MILNIFKRSQPVSFVILPVAGAILWITGWMDHSGMVITNPMPLYYLTIWTINPLPFSFAGVISLALVISQVFHFNSIVQKHEVLNRTSYVPALTFFLMSAMIPAFTTFNPIIFANSILLIVIDKTFRIYKNPNPVPLIFDSCFLIGVATMFYLPAIIFFLFFITCLFILKTVAIKEILISITGILIPFIFVVTWYFMTGTMEELYSKITYRPIGQLYNPEGLELQGHTLTIILITILFFTSLWKLRTGFYKSIIKVRRFYQLFFVFIIAGIISLLFSPTESPYRFMILVPPLSIFISNYLVSVTKNWWSELFFWLLVSLIIFNYSYPFIA
jgi:hypothetical protein